MRFDLDKVMGIHEPALLVRARRTELLANNLANTDTPGFKARDIDFKQLLAQAKGDAMTMKSTNKGHIKEGGGNVFGSDSLYRVPHQPSVDGNSVETQVEQAEFMKNALRYQASLTFLNGRISGLIRAIRGE
ncbi:MAG: flagellar basal body rod protein FlgB [Gammaproteobacteria bacterium]|nr:flagellar basal body rod protein FlgB [Gammaproteobacteria bacterium]